MGRVTLSHFTGPCLQLFRLSSSPGQNPHPRNHSHVLSGLPSQVPSGICHTLLLLPVLGYVCPWGIFASPGHWCHSHLCSTALAMYQHDYWACLLLLSVPPCLPRLADITCQAQQCTTWHCGICHLFPRAARKECWKFKPAKWSVITWERMNPTSSLNIILWQRGPKVPSCFYWGLLKFVQFIIKALLLRKTYIRVCESLEMVRFAFVRQNLQGWFDEWNGMKINE